jgi:hypothetical protein
MAAPRTRGTPISGPPSLEMVAGALRGGIGDVNVQERGLSLNRLDVVLAARTLLAGDSEVEVAHGLERVPGWVSVWEIRTDGTPVIVANAVSRERWTSSTVRVRVHAVSGSLAGAVLTLLVGGG